MWRRGATVEGRCKRGDRRRVADMRVNKEVNDLSASDKKHPWRRRRSRRARRSKSHHPHTLGVPEVRGGMMRRRSAGGEASREPSTEAPALAPAASRSPRAAPRVRVGVASLGVVAAAAFALADVRRPSRARSRAPSAPGNAPDAGVFSPREEARRRREAGNAHYHRREYAVAIACYDRSVALDPSAHATYTNRAAARMASGDASGALDDADAASRATPGGSRPLSTRRVPGGARAIRRGDARVPRGTRGGPDQRPAQGGPRARRGARVAAQPADPLDAKTRGNEAFRDGKFDDAVAWYCKGLRMCDASSQNPNPKVAATLLANRAEARRQTAEMDACLADCDAALAVDPGHAKCSRAARWRWEFSRGEKRSRRRVQSDPRDRPEMRRGERGRAKNSRVQ